MSYKAVLQANTDNSLPLLFPQTGGLTGRWRSRQRAGDGWAALPGQVGHGARAISVGRNGSSLGARYLCPKSVLPPLGSNLLPIITSLSADERCLSYR